MKTKTPLIALLIMLTLLSVSAQQAETLNMTGKWKVLKLSVVKDPDWDMKGKESQLAMVKELFEKSAFEFKADHKFDFDIAEPELAVKNGHWKYDKETDTYIIQEWKDKDTDEAMLMMLRFKTEDGKVIMMMPESPFEMEVERVRQKQD